MAGDPGFKALTLKANGRAAQLISDVSVCAAFDPKAPPDPLPPSVQARALWDTGASKSVISEAVVKDLGLTASGATNVSHAGGISISPTYVLNFYLPNGVGVVGVIATEFPGHLKFGAIIGMDIITIGDFAITNVSGKTWMSFRTPSMVTIDYVAEHNKAQFSGTPRNAPCPCGSGEKFKHCHGK